jgi:signal transduction histidine kinase
VAAQSRARGPEAAQDPRPDDGPRSDSEGEADLKTSNLQLKESRRRIVQAQEGLRRLVAQRLHGHVQNRLMVVCHYLNKAVGQLRDVDSSVTDLVTKAVGIVEEVNNQELREIAWQLHPSPVRIGLEPSLASLVRGFEHSSSTTIKFRVPRTRKRVKPRAELPEDLRLAIFRLVEEALNNVRKHASASKVVLSLEFPRADSVRVTVQDDGQGYDMQTAKPGFGTLCMLDYCDALEGTLVLESKARRGTTVTATFPIRAEQEAASEKGASKPGRLKTA